MPRTTKISAIKTKKQARLRRAKKTRAKIAKLGARRLAVHKTLRHIYAQIIESVTGKVLAVASTLEQDVRQQISNKGSNVAAAYVVGKVIAEKAIKKGITEVAFDRSGFKYNGRVKALADAAREGGIKF